MALRMSFDERIYQGIAYTIIIVCVFTVIIPLFFVVSMSLVSKPELSAHGGIYVFLVRHPTLDAYVRLMRGGWVPLALQVSAVRTVLGTLLSLSFTTLGAYVLSRKDLIVRKPMLLLILITMLFGGGLIPTYLLYRSLGLLNNFLVYLIPGMLDSFGLLVIKQFIERLPKELEDSAVIDGANDLQLLMRVVVPLSKPVLAAIGLFQAVGHWNDWVGPLIFMSGKSKLWPFQLVLRNMLQGALAGSLSAGALSSEGFQAATAATTEAFKMATVIIGTFPILCVYPFLQKYFIKGMLVGSIKG